ncbi:unnamed protein product [Paramecium sonneborni]|uniref:Uncharacterized protein n=1 Tax=Paramecium sonneborni TaxID=65129 RepID=A0A8S1NT84_9CILI|nr:unnamed protein product [Paramecium sonneborni]
MDQNQKEKESSSDEQLIKTFKEEMECYFKDIDLNQKKEKTAVILFGKTRVGKSTIYHILKGDELQKTDKGRLYIEKDQVPLIGLDNIPFTKNLNIFSFSYENQDIDIIDTPGFEDNQNPLNDLIPQIQLLKVLNSYKNILLLIVFQFDIDNCDNYRCPLFLAKNLFQSSKDFESMFQNTTICLIANKVDRDQLNEPKTCIENEIKGKAQKIQSNQHLPQEFYKAIINNIFELQKCAVKHEQVEFKESIYKFINQKRNHNQNVKFKLSLNADSKLKLNKILIGIRDIFQVEIDQSITKFIQKTQELDELQKKRDQLMQFCQIIVDDIPMSFLNEYYYQDLTKYYTALKYEECKSTKLEELRYLFEQNIIENLFQCLQEIQINLTQFIISNKNKKQEVWNEVMTIQKQIIEKIKPTEKEKQIIDGIQSSIDEFADQSYFDRLLVFIGNPLSGKSTSINLLYNVTHRKMLFKNSLMQIHFGKIEYDKVIEIVQKDKDLIIEFEQFSEDFVVLLEYFFVYCQKNQKAFSLQLVTDQDFLDEKIQLGLIKFINLNRIPTLNQFNIIQNIKQGFTDSQNVDLQKLNQIIKNPNYQKIQIDDGDYKLDQQIKDNSHCFKDFKINQIQQNELENVSQCIKKKLDGLEQQFINQIQNIQKNKKFLNEKTQFNYQLILKIKELDPDKENFENQLQDIRKIINQQLEFINDNNLGKHQKLKKLFIYLIKEYKIFEKIESTTGEFQKIFKTVEMVVEKYSNVALNQLDLINLLQQSNNVNKDLLNDSEIKCLTVLKIFYQQFQTESKTNQEIHVNKNYQAMIQGQNISMENKNSIITILNYFKKELLENIKILKELLDLLKSTQYIGYEQLDSFFLVKYFFKVVHCFKINENEETKKAVEKADYQQKIIENGQFCLSNSKLFNK